MLFESPKRVATTLSEIADVLGDRPACLARELTKQHEEVLRERASVLSERFASTPPRGECTLVIAGADEEEAAAATAWTDEEVDRVIEAGLAAGRSVKDVASEVAAAAGRNRKALYARAVELRERRAAVGGEGA